MLCNQMSCYSSYSDSGIRDIKVTSADCQSKSSLSALNFLMGLSVIDWKQVFLRGYSSSQILGNLIYIQFYSLSLLQKPILLRYNYNLVKKQLPQILKFWQREMFEKSPIYQYKVINISQIKIIIGLFKMFRNNVFTFKNLPVEEKQRKKTDCFCTICSSIFALTLFILSFVFFHKQNYYETNFPVDDSGKTCGYQLPNQPYVYFSNPNDLTSGRFCVSSCPIAGQPLQCSKQNAQKCLTLKPSEYTTEGVINRLGAFCIAKDQNVANHMWNSPQLSIKNGIINSIDIMLLSLLFGFLLGVIYLGVTTCFPKMSVQFAFVGVFIAMLFAGIYVLAKPVQLFSPNVWNILLGIGLILTGVAFLIYSFCYRKQIKLAQIFTENANIFLKTDPIVFLYIPLFLVLTFGLIVLIVWQYVAFGSSSSPQLKAGEIFKSSSQNIVLQIFNALQFVWGIHFLRDAFNFVVSGNSIQWYFRSQQNNFKSHCLHPFSRLIFKNWGSVAGGSFLNAFFGLIDLFSEMFRCDPRGNCANCSSFYKTCCCCDYLFQLVRKDAYAYINLTGIPYCNSARECEALCKYSESFRGSQSCLRLYRIAAHIFLSSIVSIICYFILAGRGVNYTNWFIIALIVLGTYLVTSYFVQLHGNAGEGLMVCYLAEHNLQKNDLQVCPPSIKSDMYNFNKLNE